MMTRHYPDLGSASDWSCRVGNLIQPIRSTTQIWVVTRHQYGISALVSQTSFGGETSGSVAKCRLFSEASKVPKVMISRVKIHLPFLVLCNWLGKYGRIYYALSFSFYLGARTAQGK